MKIAELLIGFGAGLATAVLIVASFNMNSEDIIDKHEYKILIGPKDIPECSQEIPLSIWDSMNDLQIWRWVVACVEAKEETL